MTRYIWPATVILAVAILAAGGVFTARGLRPAATVRTVTRIVRAPAPAPRTITRWKTRTVTKTRAAAAPGVPCVVAASGVPYPPGSGTMNYQTTCTVTWQESIPAALGTKLLLTDPAGHTNTFMLTGS